MQLRFALGNIEGEMKSQFLAAAALVAVSMPAFAADADMHVRHHRDYVQQDYDEPLIIDFRHNYGPADFFPGTAAPPDRVVVPLHDRPFGFYDGFDRHCGQSTASYRGADGRRYPCN